MTNNFETISGLNKALDRQLRLEANLRASATLPNRILPDSVTSYVKRQNNVYESLYQNHMVDIARETTKVFEAIATPEIRNTQLLIENYYKKIAPRLTELDFRIGVVIHEIENEIAKDPEAAVSKLVNKDGRSSFENSSKESLYILDESWEVMNNTVNIPYNLKDSLYENVNKDKTNDDMQEKNPFYKNKMWYAENVGIVLISIVLPKAISLATDKFQSIDFHKLYLVLQEILKMISSGSNFKN